jgi:hypothetical protein
MYTNAKYFAGFDGIVVSISVEINGVPSAVPLDPANTDYANIMKMQEEGKIVIAPAEQ